MIEIKIRDIPWSQVENHFNNTPEDAEKIWEKQLRGRIVGLTGDKHHYYDPEVIGYETTFETGTGNFWACEICAEIGD